MKTLHKTRRGAAQPVALLTAGAILVPTVLAGCGGGTPATAPTAPPPGIGSQTNAGQGGMSTRNKVMLLAGAAALYYLYNKRKNASAGQVQYYRSETSGRIYYRDPKTKQAIFVSPPTRPIEVPADEAQRLPNLQGMAGFNNQPTGQQFGGFGFNPNGQYSVAGQNFVPAEPLM